MPWPPRQPNRDEVAEANLPAFDMTVGRALSKGAKDAGYYGRLMGSPQMGNLLSEIGRQVRTIGDSGKSFTHAQREFVDQVLSVELKTNNIQGMHLNDALSTGVRLGAIEALRAGREEDLDDTERQLADFIRRVIGGRVDAASYEAIEAVMGEGGTLDYTIFILFLQLTMRLMSAVGMPDMPDAQVETMIADFKNGTREVEDYRTRIK